MRANVFGQIPLLDSASLVARYQFPLVRVNANVVDCVNGQPESRSSSNGRKSNLAPRCYNCDVGVYSCKGIYRNVRRCIQR